MHQSEFTFEQAGGEIAVGLGLWYDADRLVLEGVYLDEVTAYRARKGWIEAFEANFLLEERVDFRLKVSRLEGTTRFGVVCEFLTACGRYAFWRLTHHQAPEVQFILETAHLPAFSAVSGPIGFDSLERLPTEPKVVRRDESSDSREVWERICDVCSSIMHTTSSLMKWRPRR